MRGTIHEHIKAVQNWVPKARTATTYDAESPDGAIVDRQGYSEALVILEVGAIPTNGTITVTVEHGENSSLTDTAAITGAAFGALTSAAGATGFQKVGRLNLRGLGRYISANVVIANQTIPCGVTIVLGEPDEVPVGVTPTFNV